MNVLLRDATRKNHHSAEIARYPSKMTIPPKADVPRILQQEHAWEKKSLSSAKTKVAGQVTQVCVATVRSDSRLKTLSLAAEMTQTLPPAQAKTARTNALPKAAGHNTQTSVAHATLDRHLPKLHPTRTEDATQTQITLHAMQKVLLTLLNRMTDRVRYPLQVA